MPTSVVPFLMMCDEVIITVTNWNKQFLLLRLLFKSLVMPLASVLTETRGKVYFIKNNIVAI